MAKSNQITPTPFQRFIRLLRADQKEISHVYIYALFNGLILLSLPLGIQAIINLIQGGEISVAWIVLVVFVIAGVAFTGVLQMMQLRVTENLQRKIFVRSSFEFAYRIPRIQLSALIKYYPPELVNRFFDTLSVQKGLPKILIDFSTAGFQIVFGLMLLSLYHPFFILFGIGLSILMFVIHKVTSLRGLQASIQESQSKYDVAHWLEEMARTMSTFKLAGETDLPLKKTDKLVGGYLDARSRHFNILMSQYGMLVVSKVIVATGLLVVGGLLVFRQEMNIGQFVAAEIVVLMILTSVEKVIINLDTIYDVLTALEKIGQVTDLPLEESTGEDLTEVCRDEPLTLKLNKLTFSYPDLPKPIISGLDLNVIEGEKICISGPSGSGKTTLLRLIAGLYKPDDGCIYFNNYISSSLKSSSVRSVTGDVLSHEQLFKGTLSENISIGRANVANKDIQWAIAQTQLTKFVDDLPMGMETMIDPEGKRLPGTIVQKILLARAIVTRPKLLLIEDHFDSLPHPEKEELIQFLVSDEITAAMIVISNDEQWYDACDRVMYLKNGKLTNKSNMLND